MSAADGKEALSQLTSGEPPDPEGAGGPQEFIRLLRALKAWSGDPSLRELERRTKVPRSTLAQDLSAQRDRLPPLERVLVIVAACGVPASEAERWKGAWQRIHMAQCVLADAPAPEPASPEEPVDEPAVVPAPVPVRRRSPRRRPRWQAAGVLALGALLTGATVTDDRPVGPTASGGQLRYVARVSGEAGTDIPAGSTGDELQTRRAVTGGDTLVVSVALTGAASGAVSVTDTKGNNYREATEAFDQDANRLLIFVAVGVRPLDTLDRITARWPGAGTFQITAEEFRGVTAAGPTAAAEGGSRHFFTGDLAACGEGDLLFGALAGNTLVAPEFAGGWQELPGPAPMNHAFLTAYRAVHGADSCAASGTTAAAHWQAVVARLYR